MRTFPRTVRSRMAAASAVAAIVVGTLAVPFASADDLKDKQKQAETKVDRAHDNLDESSARLRKASRRLDAAKSDLAGARTALATAQGKLAVAEEIDATMQAELAEAEATLATAQADLEAGKLDVVAQRKVVARTITDLYSQGDPDLMAFASLIEAQSAQDLSRRAELNEAVVDAQTRGYDDLQAAEVLLSVNEKQVSQARDDVAVKRAAAAENLATKQALETEAEAAKASVAALVGERASARAEASQARAGDLAKLKAAEREADRIAEMLRKRALAALRRAQASRAHSSGPSGGVLASPVPGSVSSPFGYRTHPIYGYWGLHDGTDFAVSCGEPIRAAASGRVVSRYYSTVYGNRLILDHGALSGAGIASIYNHASSYTVGAGASVTRGQVIGYVGDTGWSTGCHLHFTVMANGTPVDPMNWL